MDQRTNLALRELEALTRLRLTVLLTFHHAGVTSKHLLLLKGRFEIFVQLDHGAADPQADRFCLTFDATAVYIYGDIVNGVIHFDDLEGLYHPWLDVLLRKVFFVVLTVNSDLSGSLGKVDAGYGSLTSADGINLLHLI
jgi:hypothetical protein